MSKGEAKTVAYPVEDLEPAPAGVAERKQVPGFLCVYLTNTIKISKITRDSVNRRMLFFLLDLVGRMEGLLYNHFFANF
jgi:hypothetical protein